MRSWEMGEKSFEAVKAEEDFLPLKVKEKHKGV